MDEWDKINANIALASETVDSAQAQVDRFAQEEVILKKTIEEENPGYYKQFV